MILDHLPILIRLVEFLSYSDALELAKINSKIALRMAPLLENKRINEELPIVWKNIVGLNSYYAGRFRKIEKTKKGIWQYTNYGRYGTSSSSVCLTGPEIDKVRHIKNLQLVPGIKNLINLRTIVCWRMFRVASIFTEVCQLVNLTSLDLIRCGLDEIPPEIKNLSKLVELNLSENGIRLIPDELGQLTNLKFLNLGYNQISKVPHSLSNLTSLKGLYLNHNLLSEMPDSLAQISHYLNFLKLNNNKLIEIPKVIFELRNLVSLNLSNNQISIIPLDMRFLIKLKSLHLCGNHIHQIPIELNSLKNLRLLKLAQNRILDIKPELAKLAKLDWLKFVV